MNEETIHGNTGNKNAAKPKKERLAQSRTFRFRDEEIRGYNRTKGKDEPLRIFVRRILNRECGLPPPDVESE